MPWRRRSFPRLAPSWVSDQRVVGECFKPAEVTCLRRAGPVGGVQLPDDLEGSVLLLLEVAVVVAESSGEGVIGVSFAGLPHGRVLLVRDGGQKLLMARSLGLAFSISGSCAGCGDHTHFRVGGRGL